MWVVSWGGILHFCLLFFHSNEIIYSTAEHLKQYRLCQDGGINSTLQSFRHRPLNIDCNKLSNPVWERYTRIRICAVTGANIRRMTNAKFYYLLEKEKHLSPARRMCNSQYNRSGPNRNVFYLFSVECTH